MTASGLPSSGGQLARSGWLCGPDNGGTLRIAAAFGVAESDSQGQSQSLCQHPAHAPRLPRRQTTPRRSSRSTWRPARRGGIFSSRRTTCTTGTRTRFRSSSTTGRRTRGAARRHREPQRPPLRARSEDGRVRLRRALREADVGEGTRREGRPMPIADMDPSEKGTLVYPSLQGSTNWSARRTALSPTCSTYRCARWGLVYYKTGVEYKPGTYYTGGSEKRLDEESWGAVRALDVKTGTQTWDFKLPSPPWAGVMSTAGGLVFGGFNEGTSSRWTRRPASRCGSSRPAGRSDSGPMSSLADGKQRAAVAGGHAVFVFGSSKRPAKHAEAGTTGQRAQRMGTSLCALCYPLCPWRCPALRIRAAFPPGAAAAARRRRASSAAGSSCCGDRLSD